MRGPILRRWAIGWLLGAAGCVYSFENPIEQRPLGAVLGRVVLQAAAAGETPAGGQVQILWTPGLSVPLTASGQFYFTDLPDGVYALQFAAPPLDAGLVGEVAGLVLPRVQRGPDALNVGDLDLPVGGFVAGMVGGATGPITVASFAPGDGGALGRYEAFAANAVDGGFDLTLPVGFHLLAATDGQGNSAIAAVQVAPLSSQQVNLTLLPPQGTAVVSGHLVLGGDGRGAGSSLAEVGPLLAQVSYAAVDAKGQTVATGPFSDGTGAFALRFSAGGPVTVTLQPPAVAAPDPCDVFPPLPLSGLPRVAGQVTDLGQVTWLTNRELAENGLGPCAVDGGGTTSSGSGSVGSSGGSSSGGSRSNTGSSGAGSGGGSSGGTTASAATGSSGSSGSSTGGPLCGTGTSGAGPGLLASPLLQLGQGGILASPQVAVITYANDPNSKLLANDVTWLDGYLPQRLGAYGVGAIQSTSLTVSDLPPDSLAVAQSYLADHFNSFDLARLGNQLVVLVEVPAAQSRSFCNSSGEYNHFTFSDSDGGMHPFAVVADCLDGGDIARVEQLTSDILAETFTDPFGGGWQVTDPTNPYSYNNGQISDLCAAASYRYTDPASGFSAGLLWSNLEAADGGVPCQPWPPSSSVPPYLALNVSPRTTQVAPAGQVVNFTLTGWASACYPPWQLDLSRTTSTNQFNASPTVSSHTLSAGESVTLSLTIPSSAASGEVGTAWVLCRDSQGGYLGSVVVAVQAQ